MTSLPYKETTARDYYLCESNLGNQPNNNSNTNTIDNDNQNADKHTQVTETLGGNTIDFTLIKNNKTQKKLEVPQISPSYCIDTRPPRRCRPVKLTKNTLIGLTKIQNKEDYLLPLDCASHMASECQSNEETI